MTAVERISNFDLLGYSANLDVERLQWKRRERHGTASIHSQLSEPASHNDLVLADLVARARPKPLREFDQIPMRTSDLARQAKLVAPLLENQKVAFVGDMDGAAALLGLLAVDGGPAPESLLVLDFDVRVIAAAESLARKHGLVNKLTTRLYNVFDPVPDDLRGEYDWFYSNPPYGSQNQGASARLFLTRGCELVGKKGSGCAILPDDPVRPWSRTAMFVTQQFLLASGWMIREKVDQLHRYHLDDDPELSSSLIIVDRAMQETDVPMPYAGRSVEMNEIPNFYERATLPPYPRSIGQDGSPRAAERGMKDAGLVH